MSVRDAYVDKGLVEGGARTSRSPDIDSDFALPTGGNQEYLEQRYNVTGAPSGILCRDILFSSS